MADRSGVYEDRIRGRVARTFVDQGDGTYALRLSARALGAQAADIIGEVFDHEAGEIPVLYVKQPDGTYALKVVIADTAPAAPIGAGYLVTAADPTLTNEVVVGATPGGELGGTWDTPTVDASHSGSTHAATQAAAEATAAADVATHAAISAASTHGNLGHASTNDPTANQKAALAGTGTPSATDKYVSDSDPRNTNSRAPSGGASGELGGSYPSPTVNATHSGSAHLALATNAVLLGTAAAAGAAATTLRSNDTIAAFDLAAPVTQAYSDAAAVGVVNFAARRDHKHGMPAAGGGAGGTPAVVLGTAAAAGVAATFLRDDDTIVAFDVTAPTTQAFGDAAVVGVAAVATRRDHKHAMPAFATNAVLLGSAAAAGAATTPMRSNDTIAAFDATAPSTQAFRDAAAVGTIAFAARRDHKHAMMAGWTFLGGATASAAIRTGTITWTGTWAELMFEYMIAGYSAGAIGRLIVGPTAGLSETGTTFCTSLIEGVTLNTTSVSVPGWPTAVTVAAVPRYGWMFVSNIAAVVKRMTGEGLHSGTAPTVVPTQMRMAGLFNDSTNLINKAELAVYDAITGATISATTFNAGTYLNAWGRNTD